VSFALYLTGFLIVIAGLTYGAVLVQLPADWIVAGGLVLAGVGVLMGSKPLARKIRHLSRSAQSSKLFVAF
jgi:hypothetical protein